MQCFLEWCTLPEEQNSPRSKEEQSLEMVGLRFEISILEYLHEKDPRDLETMASLAEVYTRAGEVEAGLEIDLQLVKLAPSNAVFHYNLACSYSLLKSVDASLDELEIAIRLGYSDIDHLKKDPDLRNIQSSPRFKTLLNSIRT
jgi:hypothetical protein